MIQLDEMEFHGGIHTMEVVLYDVPYADYTRLSGITSTENKALFPQTYENTETGELIVFLDAKVNVNRFAAERDHGGREYWIDTFTEFVDEFENCIAQVRHSRYEIKRIDFRIDEYQHSFRELLKWNRTLLEVLKETWELQSIENIKNQTIRTKCSNEFGRCIQVYDKPAETNYRTQMVKTRFEIQDTIQERNLFFDWQFVRDRGINYTAYSLEHLNFVPAITEKINSAAEKEAKSIVRSIKKKIEENEQNGLSYNKANLIQQYRYRIFSAHELRLICKGIGLREDTAYRYGTRYKLTKEYLDDAAIISYGRKLGLALDEFLST